VNPATIVQTRPLPANGSRRRWRLLDSPLRNRLAHVGIPALIALLLENRGIRSRQEAALFIGGKEPPARDPYLLPDFEAAVLRLRRAVLEREAVTVFGDFDVDGMTSTAAITDAINDLGGHARPYIPNREREGYGLNLRAVEMLAASGTRLLLTCDCGTSSIAEVERAQQVGMDVIVLDHHSPPPELPRPTALVNPKLPTSRHGFSEYSTAGLAYLVAGALYDACRRPFPEQRYADLAALGTVADMVPLVDENRQIVRRGLRALADSSRPGVRALVAASGIDTRHLSSESIAFALTPRLNAAGRLDDASVALDLLLCRDEERASELASRLDELNRERQLMTREAEDLARDLLEEKSNLPLLLVGDERFHQGIVGLVASRLVETYGRPALVYQRGDCESRGSCRSIEAYDIVSGLRSCHDLFERYGGHSQAGGFTVRNERLEALEERMLAHASHALAGVELGPFVNIDAEWPLGLLRSQEIKWISKLGPFGMGNKEPVLLSRGVTAVEARPVGEDGRHLRLRLKEGNVTWPAIAFGYEGEPPAEGQRLDLVYSLSSDRYGPSYEGNGAALQLTIVDLAPSAS
jgi:single-stranded-DNA-specific exonuclease